MAPRISVIIPCYNLGRYIDEAVDSVLAQTRSDCEIIVVNDGSTDAETNEVLARYDRPCTRVLVTPNRGVSAARNTAMAEARGDYVCALDADDRLHPAFFEKAGAVLDREPSITFVSCWLEMFGDDSSIWRQQRCDLVTLLYECTVATPALTRRRALVAVGGYDESFRVNEDWELWIRLAGAGYSGTVLQEVLFYYRRRPDSLSAYWLNGEAHLRAFEQLLEKHRDLYAHHLVDVLVRKEQEACDLLRRSYELELDIEQRLAPRLKLLIASSAADYPAPNPSTPPVSAAVVLAPQHQELLDTVAAYRRRIDELTASHSWRVTAPLRAAHAVLVRLKALAGVGA
jgi:GT2 family glycosyltransferase